MLSPLVAPSIARALSFASSENSTTMKTGESPYIGRVGLPAEVFMLLGLLRGPLPGSGTVGSADANEALGGAEGTRGDLGAVMVASGGRVVVRVGSVGPIGAGLVLVVGLVVPSLVVEVGIVIGDLVAVQPVDGNARTGGSDVVTGIDGIGASDRFEQVTVVVESHVASGGSGLDPSVVGADG